MKHLIIITTLFQLLISQHLVAQYDAFTYQGILLDESSEPITNTAVVFSITISADADLQNIYYKESQLVNTDDSGTMSFKVGQGDVQLGAFDNIAWLVGIPYITIEYDLNDNNGMRSLGTTRFKSVMFAIESRHVVCQDGLDGPVGAPGAQGPQGIQGPPGPIGSTPTGPRGNNGRPIMAQLDTPPFQVPAVGNIYLDDGTNRTDTKPGFRYYDGTNWIDLGGD